MLLPSIRWWRILYIKNKSIFILAQYRLFHRKIHQCRVWRTNTEVNNFYISMWVNFDLCKSWYKLKYGNIPSPFPLDGHSGIFNKYVKIKMHSLVTLPVWKKKVYCLVYNLSHVYGTERKISSFFIDSVKIFDYVLFHLKTQQKIA